MIKVNINKKNNEIDHVSISGHSGYAEKGFDIVCIAVSSIVTTTVNAILSFKETIKVTDDGKLLEISIKEHDEITDKLIANMIELLKEIEKEYKDNIRLEEKLIWSFY